MTVASGVAYRRFPAGSPLGRDSGASVLDVDMAAPGIRVKVVSERPQVKAGRVYAEAHTVSDWCRRSHAIGGINGGFFGVTDGMRKEVIGLLAAGGEIHSTGRLVQARGLRGTRFARSVLGFDATGRPQIAWAAGTRGRAALLTLFQEPVNPRSQGYWQVDSAVACGPRLIQDSAIRIHDHEERLVSPAALPRTFVGYDLNRGRPAHLALCVAQAMTFADAAAFLQSYFGKYHRSAYAQAMALDGGASSQLAYRAGSDYADAMPTLVTVPTAVLILNADH